MHGTRNMKYCVSFSVGMCYLVLFHGVFLSNWGWSLSYDFEISEPRSF